MSAIPMPPAPPPPPVVTPPPTPALPAALAALATWARAWNVEKNPYVEGMLTAANNGDLASFADLSPRDNLPVPVVSAGHQIGRIGEICLRARNAIVFLPVALTWLAISKAVSAYGTYTASVVKPDQPITFVQFWQDSNGALDGRWRLSNVASFDVLVIMLIIGLTLVGAGLHARASRLDEQARDRRDRERELVALDLAIYMRRFRITNDETVEESVARFLTDLRNAAIDVLTAAERLEQASQGAAGLEPALDTLNQRLGGVTQAVEGDLTVAVRTLTDSVSDFGTRVRGDTADAVRQATAGIVEIAEAMEKTAVAVGDTANTVAFSTDQLARDLQTIHDELRHHLPPDLT